MAKISGIYLITCLIDKKVYVGQSADIYRRWKEHTRDLNKKEHRCQHLQNAWDKYGEGNFEFAIIQEVGISDRTPEEATLLLASAEEFQMRVYRCGNRDYAFNDNTPLKSNFGNAGMPCGKDHPSALRILQYDLNGKFIKEWDTITEAGEALKINKSSISSCAKKFVKTAGEYIWRYREGPIAEQIENILQPISQYDLYGWFIKEWYNINEIRDFLKLEDYQIKKVKDNCENKEVKAIGYIWKYKKNNFIRDRVQWVKEYDSKPWSRFRILQFTLENEYIKSYDTITEAEETGFTKVHEALYQRKTHQANGYKWYFDYEIPFNFITDQVTPNPKLRWFRQEIQQYDLEGNYIRSWNKIADAEKELNISGISQCINGSYTHAGGFKWKFIQEYVDKTS